MLAPFDRMGSRSVIEQVPDVDSTDLQEPCTNVGIKADKTAQRSICVVGDGTEEERRRLYRDTKDTFGLWKLPNFQIRQWYVRNDMRMVQPGLA